MKATILERIWPRSANQLALRRGRLESLRSLGKWAPAFSRSDSEARSARPRRAVLRSDCSTTVDVDISGLSKSFGNIRALSDVSLRVRSGELVALLGPSGSGKTTMLRAIAGMENPEVGNICIGGKAVEHLPIRERDIGFVFQHYALFPNMRVFDNIGYGLKVRKEPTAHIAARVEELLSLMQLKGLAHRFPHELSGGQRQRVALARALAPHPRVLLLDEPFGALDAQVRDELRVWLRRMHDELHVTSIFVTHDQQEAFEVADRVVIMNHGEIEQIGTPTELWEQPTSSFVMEFLGGATPIGAVLSQEHAAFGSMRVPLAFPVVHTPGAGTCYVRAADVHLRRATEPSQGGALARITSARRLGARTRVEVSLAMEPSIRISADLTSREWHELEARVGDITCVEIQKAFAFPT